MNSRPIRILIVAAAAGLTVIAVVFKVVRLGGYGGDGWIVLVISCLLSGHGAVRAAKLSTSQFNDLFRNADFRRGFWLWFSVAVGFFFLANLIPHGSGMPDLGMPLEFAPTFGYEVYAGAAVLLNIGLAIAHSYLCGVGFAFARVDHRPVGMDNPVIAECNATGGHTE